MLYIFSNDWSKNVAIQYAISIVDRNKTTATKINWEDGNNSKCKNKVFLWSYKTRAKLSLLNRVKDNCKIISTDNDSIYSI